MTPFDYLNSINQGTQGEDLFTTERSIGSGETVQDYNCFIVNRGLSYHNDSVLLANEMNKLPDLPHIMQFDFYRHTLRPRKRFAKWVKQQESSNDIKIIQKAFDYSREKAEQVYDLFDKKQIKQLRSLFDEGGK
tara:strand:- start:1799 stop:2200 length:402 start_codon:yes stop_codon:yes gene_type:complete